MVEHEEHIANDPTPLESPPLSRNDLADAIGFEIDSIHRRVNHAGWTAWALVGALAAIAWIVSTELREFVVQETELLLVVVMMIMGFNSLECLVYALQPSVARGGGVRLRMFDTGFAGDRLVAVFLAVLGAVMAVAMFVHKFHSTGALFAPAYWYGFVSLVAASVLLLSFLRIPVVVRNPNAVIKCIALGSGILLAIGAVSLASVALQRGVDLNHIRLGGLCAAAVVVVFFLLKQLTISPLLETLIQLRRDLMTGRVSLPACRERFEIAVLGMEAAGVVQDDVSECLAIYKHMSEIQDGTQERLTAIRSKFDTDKNQRVLCEAALSSASVAVSVINSYGKRADNALRKLQAKATSLKRIASQSAQDLDALIRRVEEQREKIAERQAIIESEIEQLSKLLASEAECPTLT
jgi:hypothetical protein